MNEITFTGNVSKIHGARHTQAGDVIFSFDLAVDNGYFDRNRNRWMYRTRFQPVVVYRQLAENTAETLSVGMAVTVTGKLLDDSFTPDGSDYPVRRDKLEALDVAVSLRSPPPSWRRSANPPGTRAWSTTASSSRSPADQLAARIGRPPHGTGALTSHRDHLQVAPRPHQSEGVSACPRRSPCPP